MSRFVVGFITVYLPLVSSALYGQESRASLGGRVTDPQGAAVGGAQVEVTAVDTGVVQRARTNDKGNWTVLYLLPGDYRFQVTASGFETVQRAGIELQVADNKTIDVSLTIGSSSQSVVVTADAPLIDTSSATSGMVIGGKEIVEMPSLSRVPSDLANLSAGVVATDPSNNPTRAWSHDAIAGLRIGGGAGVRTNNYLLDGFPNVKAGGQLAFSPPPDSLSEFRVQMNSYDASVGRQAGGTLNMTTKSGASRFHGNLYEFNQNNILNAQLFQTNLSGGQKPAVHYNEYGGTVGGPVWIPKVYNGKQRTFFFLSFNGIRNTNPTFSVRSVPNALEREGDFSQSYTTQVQNGQRITYPVQVFDPATVDSKGNRTMFPGNRVPVNRLNPIARNILNYIPLPNRASDGTSTDNNNFIPDSIRNNKMAAISARADHQWNDNNKTFGVLRWYHEDEFAYDDFKSPATGGYQTRVAQGLGLDHVVTVSSNKVLDLRFNVMRYGDTSQDNGAGFDMASLGFPTGFTSQLQVPSFPRITGVAGDFGTTNAGAFTWTNYYTWSASLAHVIGDHTLHYGGEYWVLQQATTNIGNQGQFDFSNVWTRQNSTVGGGIGNGDNFASYLLGLPASGNVPVNASGFYSQRFTGFYFQDDWRVTSKLTLSFGLRWDYERPVQERYNRMVSNFDPNAMNPTSAAIQANYASIAAANQNNANIQALLGLAPTDSFQVRGAQLFNGVNGQARGINDTDLHEFQPRFGFAYRLTDTTVIRGGIGRFATATFDTGGQNGFNRTTPFTASQDNNTTPYDTLSNPFQNSIQQPTGSSLGALTNLGQGVSWYNQNFNRPHSLILSVTLQQQIKSWLLELGYSHNKNYGTAWSRNQNLPSFDVWNQLRTARFDPNGRPLDKLQWDELVPNPFYNDPNYSGGIATSKQVSINQLIRPLTYLGDQSRANNPWGTTQYDAMLLNVSRRFSKGFSFKGAFTWSKLIDQSSFLGPEIAQHANHVISPVDRPFNFSIAPIWDLPIGRGKKFWNQAPKWADAIVGGWQLTGQYSWQSGLPVSFDGSDSFFYDGQNAALSKDKRTLGEWFDTSHFIRFPDKNTDIGNYPAWTGIQYLPGYNYKPASGDTIKNGVYQDFGNYVRTIPTRWTNIRADNNNTMSLGIYKNMRFFERYSLQYRFETFNTLNHPRFGAPNANPTSSSFGQVSPSQVNNARLVQMALKLSF